MTIQLPINAAVCRNPVFVVGCHRSGTTVLAASLAAHSRLWGSRESHFFLHILNAVQEAYFLGTLRDNMWLRAEGVTLEELLMHIGIGINSLYTEKAGGLRWVEKTPHYGMQLDALSSMFPEAQFIHVVRNGRNTVTSMLHSGMPSDWATDFRKACESWVRLVEPPLSFEEAHPERILRVHHEDIAGEPERKMKDIFSFLDMEYEHSTIELYNSNERINSSFSSDEERACSRWERDWTEEQKEIFVEICGPLSERLGYEASV